MSAGTLPFEFLALFGLGFLISLGHCIGMCGPLQGAFSIARGRKGRGWRLAGALAAYHAGRLLSYGTLGAIFGLMGSVLVLGGRARAWQGGLSILTGMIMLPLGLGLLGWLPTARWIEGNPLARRISSRLARLLAGPAAGTSLLLGLANGFLPCGPVYTAGLTATSTASPWLGFLAMIFYGTGTLPVLLAFGWGSALLGRPSPLRILGKVAAVLVLLIGVQLMLRGMAAFGLFPHWRIGKVVFW